MSVKTYDEFMNKIVYWEYLFSFGPICIPGPDFLLIYLEDGTEYNIILQKYKDIKLGYEYRFDPFMAATGKKSALTVNLYSADDKNAPLTDDLAVIGQDPYAEVLEQAESSDGTFTADEESEVIQILKSFRIN